MNLKTKLFLNIFFAGILTVAFAVSFQKAYASGKDDGTNVQVHLRGVYDAKVTVSAIEGMKKPELLINDVQVVNNGTLEVSIPEKYLPGEFLFRFNYRKQASDHPYPAEINLFVAGQDLGLHVNPLYPHGDSLVIDNDIENKVFNQFMLESNRQRQQIGLLQQLVQGYANPRAKIVKKASKELKKHFDYYNEWIDEQQRQNNELYVSHLFGFQHIPSMEEAPENTVDAITQMAQQYLSVVNFSDTLVLRSRQINEFMGGYIGLFSQLATTESLRDSLFTLAGSIACNKASSGNPKVYGWMVDYFFMGYESYNIEAGTKMLMKHLENPNCLISKKQAIQKRLEGMKTMVVGAEAPTFEAQMVDSIPFRFDGVPKDKGYGLLVFYDTTCGHCSEFIQELRNWYAHPENAAWFNVTTVALNEKRQEWINSHNYQQFAWNDVWAPGGINSKAAEKYYVLGTPAIYIVDHDLKILAMPENMKGIEKFLNEE